MKLLLLNLKIKRGKANDKIATAEREMITLNLQLMIYVELKYPRLFKRSLISHSNISSGFFNKLKLFTSRYWLITSKSHYAFISSGSVGMKPEAKIDFSSFTLGFL